MSSTRALASLLPRTRLLRSAGYQKPYSQSAFAGEVALGSACARSSGIAVLWQLGDAGVKTEAAIHGFGRIFSNGSSIFCRASPVFLPQSSGHLSDSWSFAPLLTRANRPIIQLLWTNLSQARFGALSPGDAVPGPMNL